uniref:ERCC1-like central domain-containing protein n=1 Tax=Leptobrachium leishanense TaxID=445787 RepID=A0A8C5PR32_9ANUR
MRHSDRARWGAASRNRAEGESSSFWFLASEPKILASASIVQVREVECHALHLSSVSLYGTCSVTFLFQVNMEAHDSNGKGDRHFIIPSQLPEASQVRPLFQAKTVEQLAPVLTCETYADFVIQQEPMVTGQADCKNVSRENRGLSASHETVSTTTLPGGRNNIVVSTRQRGNPVLKHIRNVPWEFGEIIPDYVLGETSCALFLSLRYHNLNPEYIHSRLRSIGQCFALRVLLVQVDVKDPHFSLKELAKICILSDCTLILSWSSEEAARYLETYKSYEQKPADVLKEKMEKDFISRMTECLTTVKSVNKTDSCTLLTTFGVAREGGALCQEEGGALCQEEGGALCQENCSNPSVDSLHKDILLAALAIQRQVLNSNCCIFTGPIYHSPCLKCYSLLIILAESVIKQ